MNFNSIEKNEKVDKKPISVIDCFFYESTLSSKSDKFEVANLHILKKDELNILRKRLNVNDRQKLDKASTSILDISLFDEFYLYVGEFKMHHKKKVIIGYIFTSTILLNIITVSFNSNSNFS